MKFSYYPETGSLYIDLSDRPSADSREVSPGVVLDFDDSGALVGIDIDGNLSQIDLESLELIGVPKASLRSRTG